jgi:hypothetical protein
MEDIKHDAFYSDSDGNVKQGSQWIKEYKEKGADFTWDYWYGNDLTECIANVKLDEFIQFDKSDEDSDVYITRHRTGRIDITGIDENGNRLKLYNIGMFKDQLLEELNKIEA